MFPDITNKQAGQGNVNRGWEMPILYGCPGVQDLRQAPIIKFTYPTISGASETLQLGSDTTGTQPTIAATLSNSNIFSTLTFNATTFNFNCKGLGADLNLTTLAPLLNNGGPAFVLNDQAANEVLITCPALNQSVYYFSLPATQGKKNQTLVTDTSGQLSFVNADKVAGGVNNLAYSFSGGF